MNARVCLMLLSLLVLLAMLFIVPSFKENSLVLIFTYFMSLGMCCSLIGSFKVLRE